MKHDQSSETGKYWERHILSWDESAYWKCYEQREHLSFVDRLSTLLRRDRMYVRMNAALDLLLPYVPGLITLDVGCGSGRFAIQLLEVGASRVVGVDIAASAIQLANKRRNDSDFPEKLEFFRADVIQPDVSLPEVDLVTALGVIEYFDPDSLAVFLGNLKTRYFFLDFPHRKKKSSPRWMLRKIYLSVNQCAGVFFYSLEEFSNAALLAGFTDVWLAKHSGFYFVTNLPKNSNNQEEG